MEDDIQTTDEDNKRSTHPVDFTEEQETDNSPCMDDGHRDLSESSIEELRRRLPEYLCEPIEFSVSSKVQDTFERFSFIHSKGRRLNDEIHKNRRISNPYFVANTLKQYNVDQGATGMNTEKRRKLMDMADVDSIEAFRQHRKQQRQMQQQSTVKRDDASKMTDNMTVIRQEAISQFVMDAKQRLQSMQKTKL